MDLTVETGLLGAVILVSIRLGALLVFSPLFALANVPIRIRVLMTLALSVMLVSTLEVPSATFQTTGEFVRSSLVEVLIGGLMAFGMHAAFAAFQFGGRLLDYQMGFGVASLIDPSTHAQVPLIGTALNLVAVLVFFLVNGHHLMLKGLAYTLQAVPPGGDFRLEIAPVIAAFGSVFVFGVMVIAPALAALFLIDVALAVMSRTMPQINIFIVGFPLKIVVGLSLLAVSLSHFAPVLERIYHAIFRYWTVLF